MYISNTAVIGGSIKDASRKSCFVDSGLVGKTSENSLYRKSVENLMVQTKCLLYVSKTYFKGRYT